MATKLGDISIAKIEPYKENDQILHWEVSGNFQSIYDQNVGSGTSAFGTTALEEARRHLHLPPVSREQLKREVDHVHFATENTSATAFTIAIVGKATVLEGLAPTSWDSYSLG